MLLLIFWNINLLIKDILRYAQKDDSVHLDVAFSTENVTETFRDFLPGWLSIKASIGHFMMVKATKYMSNSYMFEKFKKIPSYNIKVMYTLILQSSLVWIYWLAGSFLCLRVLAVTAWPLFMYAGFLTQSKDMYAMLTCEFRVWASAVVCSPVMGWWPVLNVPCLLPKG